MRRRQFTLAYPALALVGATFFGLAAVILVRGSFDVAEQLSAANDPVKIANRALARRFNRDVANREIRSALATGDIDLAQSFVDLAADRNVSIDSALAGKVKEASANQGSVSNIAQRFVHGFWTGAPTDLASFAGTALSDLFVFGDIRDATREATHYLTGQHYDPWILGLAGSGIAFTAATYVTLGAEVPERVGLSLIKAARRTDHLNPVLAMRVTRDFVKVRDAEGLVDLAENTGRVQAKAGTQAALDSLAVAKEPQDMSRLARLAAAKGTKTRAILKLLGPGAYLLAASVFDLAMWLLWAAFAVLGFFSSCKAAVERMTERHILRQKLHRARKAELRMLACPSN
jgi:hypothetical protein